MDSIAVKQALRGMKKLEIRLRFGEKAPVSADLVWNRFFSLRGENPLAKYSLETLLAMTAEAFKQAGDEYWSFVFAEICRENGESPEDAFNPALLFALGLPADADSAAIKCRFRALAKKTHPDTGGSAEEFVRVTEIYQALANEKKRGGKL